MNDAILLPWTARGLRYDTRGYLIESAYTDDAALGETEHAVHRKLLLGEAQGLIRQMKLEAMNGPPVEYGCFDIDGRLLEPGMRMSRQIKNILYYMIAGFFNVARDEPELGPGFPIGHNEPIPNLPGEDEWGLMLSEENPARAEVIEALQPLIDHRGGRVIEAPAFDDVDVFRPWLQDQFHGRLLPPYLLICEDFSKVSLEIQFVLNAFLVTGRLWFSDPSDYAVYASKVVASETGAAGARRLVLASPGDDTVTYVDCRNLVRPMLAIPAARNLGLESLIAEDFDREALLAAAAESSFLGLYSHGIALTEEEEAQHAGLQGAFVLKFGAKGDEGLLDAAELSDRPFVPGGIFFSPACLCGGMQGNSDYAAWIDPKSLARLGGSEARLSDAAVALLKNPEGPAAFLAHFDISMASNAPMLNTVQPDVNLQTMLHTQLIKHLDQGWTLGRASKPFRWAAGNYYARAIHTFSKLTGTLKSTPDDLARPVGDMVTGMSRDHVTATDFRNFVILGDPAVRLGGR